MTRSLTELERDGSWLFHGSGLRSSVLEPRQAFNWEGGVKRPDGPPAVFATDVVAVAVFMAVMPSALGGHGHFEFGRDATALYRFRASSLAGLDGARGLVHVVPRAPFVARAHDWMSTESVVPVAVFEVTGADLPPITVG